MTLTHRVGGGAVDVVLALGLADAFVLMSASRVALVVLAAVLELVLVAEGFAEADGLGERVVAEGEPVVAEAEPDDDEPAADGDADEPDGDGDADDEPDTDDDGEPPGGELEGAGGVVVVPGVVPDELGAGGLEAGGVESGSGLHWELAVARLADESAVAA